MTETEKSLQYIRNWKAVGEELDQVKAAELRAMTEEESAERIHNVLLMTDEWFTVHQPASRECGLVEQQRIFKKWRQTLI